jgi:hypothetical protein
LVVLAQTDHLNGNTMIRHLHLLMALPSEDGPIAFAAKKAESLPVEGIRLYFPGGTRTRPEHIGQWLKRLNRNPLGWVEPSVDLWTVDVDGAKQRFTEELAKSYPYRAEFIWPHWLSGKIPLSPEFESGEGFAPRLTFFITEFAIAKAKDPAKYRDSAPPFNQFFFGDVQMNSEEYNLSNMSGQIGAVGRNAHTEGSSFSQHWEQMTHEFDLTAVATELGTLRRELRKEATEIEQDKAVASVGAAEAAAKNKDGPAALKHLKEAGSWAFDVATKIGTTVAAKMIESSLRM